MNDILDLIANSDVLSFVVYRLIPGLLQAIPVTLELTIICCVVGNLLAVPIAVARVSPKPYLWIPSYIYILLMRGTPLLVQIYLIYYGLGQLLPHTWVRHSFLWPYLRDGFWYAIFALSLNTAGYTGEILRGAIQAVPHGETEAGKAFGMSGWLIFRRITLPRAIRICLPTMSTETVLLLKSTSLASTITVMDVMGTARWLQKQSFRTYEPLIAAGIIYVILVFILTRFLNWLERRLNRDREQPVALKAEEILGNA
ncbi:MAG TPA: ABC transporter permease [Dongiaceae bacterium]|nr:ABC transporter permease [Dongiaceae bacterium]